MKRKVLSELMKKTLYVSLVCASLCGTITPSQVYAADKYITVKLQV